MPPRARLGAVVIDDALQPLAADVGIGAVGEDRRVLPRDRALIREPIGHPALQLPLREPAFVHQLVKGMARVVGRAERAQGAGEIVRRERLRRGPGTAAAAARPARRHARSSSWLPRRAHNSELQAVDADGQPGSRRPRPARASAPAGSDWYC